MAIIFNYIRRHHKAISFYCFFTLLNVFFLCWSYSSNDLPFNAVFIAMLIMSIVVETALFYIIYKTKKKQWPIEKIFVCLASIIGIFYVLALPIGRAPDEESHFFRAYEISTGHLVSDTTNEGSIGSFEPSDIEIIRSFKENNVSYAEIAENMNQYPNEDNQSFIINSAYNYNLLSYSPQVVGIWIGRLLHLPFTIIIYLAKLLNLFACITILYFSLKFIPFLKNILFLLAFLPITMQSMSSFSPDGLVIATATALISFVLYTIYTLKTKLSTHHFFLMFFICLFLSMSKIAYAPLCLLLFAIPKERFTSTSKKYLIIFGMGAALFIILLTWLLLAPSMQSVSDSSTQISTILHNPIKYIAIVLHSLSTNFNMYFYGFFGGYLEWFNVVLSPLYIIPSFVVFIILCHTEYQNSTITKSFKVIAAVSSLVLVLITFTTMFIQWTKVGESVIDGVQGRYFLPIMLLIPTFFLPIKKPNSKSISKKYAPNYYLYAFIVFESIYAITSIACSHL